MAAAMTAFFSNFHNHVITILRSHDRMLHFDWLSGKYLPMTSLQAGNPSAIGDSPGGCVGGRIAADAYVCRLPPIHLSTYPPIHPPYSHPPLHQPTYPLTHPYIYPPLHLPTFTYPLLCLPTQPYTYPPTPTHPYTYPLTHPYTYTPLYLPTPMPTHPALHLLTYAHPPLHLPTHPYTYPSTHQPGRSRGWV